MFMLTICTLLPGKFSLLTRLFFGWTRRNGEGKVLIFHFSSPYLLVHPRKEPGKQAMFVVIV
jgi:hypothetical protein